MPRGGKRAGPGRKHRLTPAEREDVARQYHDRMKAYAAAQAYVRDQNTIKWRDKDKQMRDLAKTHIAIPGDERELLDPEEDVVWPHKRISPKLAKLKAERDSIPPHEPAATPKRAKGVRDGFLRDIAEEFKISKRMVKSCINEFKNIF